MSALTDGPASRSEPVGRPRLEARPGLAGGRRLSGLPFTVLVVGLLAVGLGGCLWLKTTLQEQAFELSGLRAEAERLGNHAAFLQAGLAIRTTPAELARSAADLGMAPNPYGVFLILPTGQVQGVPHPVSGTELPSMAPPTPVEPTTDPAVNGDPSDPAGAGGQSDPVDPAAVGDPASTTVEQSEPPPDPDQPVDQSAAGAGQIEAGAEG
ncbi:MAG: hypothetical protein LBJ44_11090 [Propionibacteriaceae bacterium]|jgi:hypothetical protein|nr:hypothetical protein [Propionibacteriaceae bacterium]